jgi:phospholipase/lecithinase/hemolysin
MSRSTFLSRIGRGLGAIALPLSVITLASEAAEAANFQGLYVFGDSLANTGKTLTLIGGAVPTRSR